MLRYLRQRLVRRKPVSFSTEVRKQWNLPFLDFSEVLNCRAGLLIVAATVSRMSNQYNQGCDVSSRWKG